ADVQRDKHSQRPNNYETRERSTNSSKLYGNDAIQRRILRKTNLKTSTTVASRTPTSILPPASPAGRLIAARSTSCMARRMKLNRILQAAATDVLWKKVAERHPPFRLSTGVTAIWRASARRSSVHLWITFCAVITT